MTIISLLNYCPPNFFPKWLACGVFAFDVNNQVRLHWAEGKRRSTLLVLTVLSTDFDTSSVLLSWRNEKNGCRFYDENDSETLREL